MGTSVQDPAQHGQLAQHEDVMVDGEPTALQGSIIHLLQTGSSRVGVGHCCDEPVQNTVQLQGISTREINQSTNKQRGLGKNMYKNTECKPLNMISKLHSKASCKPLQSKTTTTTTKQQKHNKTTFLRSILVLSQNLPAYPLPSPTLTSPECCVPHDLRLNSNSTSVNIQTSFPITSYTVHYVQYRAVNWP